MTFIPVFIIGLGLLALVYDSLGKLQALKELQLNTYKIKNISQLILDLQQERGLSSGFLGSGGKKFTAQVKEMRRKVDSDCTKISFDSNLTVIRHKIDALSISTIDAFSSYTGIVKNMQEYYLKTSMNIDDAYLVKQFQIYINLSYMQEALGRVRGSFNGVFTRRKGLDRDLLYNAFHSKGMYDSSQDRFLATSSQQYINALQTIASSPEYGYIKHIVDKYTSLQFGNPTEDPQKWFNTATHIINQIANIETSHIEMIDTYIRHKTHTIRMQIISQISFFLLMLFFSSRLSYKLRNAILRNIALLQQYKDAVDRSSIVSKTTKSGRITYANDKFCAISGYTRDKLVGKAHNIIRHPDMPKEAFKDMWDTILDKRPWTGIVKNKKKYGDFYIVEATINPILNHKGEIEEFIAIRNDVTEIIALQEDLEHTQEELIVKMGIITEKRSRETASHVKRVARYSQLLARLYGLKDDEIKNLTDASPMHDIGKVGIPDEILTKPAKLTPDEWAIMQTHTSMGYDLFKDSDKPLFRAAAIITHEHHEKYDGSGYPRGLKGEEIHIYGRITAIADVFDALGSGRYYKEAWSDQEIFALLKEERGKHFDPKLIDIFFEHLDEFLEIRNVFCSSV